jgi:hypothetical protein
VPQPPPSGPGGVSYSVSLTPEDVGARVVLRRRLPAPPPGTPPLGDVLGDLLSWAGGRLTVRTRSGETVTVEESALLAAKRVPPAPPRRRPRA